jgi:LmbE family N-acetylglucosaminyl deacetylase
MSTLAFLHAHPDDESIVTGGSMAKYAAAGHRVVLVVATGGEHGEVPADLGPEETLGDRRRGETDRSVEILGIESVRWLGYEDSGMNGWEQNDHPGSFHQAPVDEAAGRLADILREIGADVLTTYDWHGNYGHPDHVKVHTVGHRAADLAGTPALFDATMNREHLARLLEAARANGQGPSEGEGPRTDDGEPFGMPEAEITTAVDVREFIAVKRASMAAHASQMSDASFLLGMPDDAFLAAFGTEWYIRRGAPPGITEHELL